ncbi:MAG TPA: hypothetical protein VFR64_01595 [Methylomirabilota bacterium]|nr:hypothetical protein [Methylomirabilota bacterium]
MGLLAVVGGCVTVPEVPEGGVESSPVRAERDRRECVAATQTALGRDFVVDRRGRRIVTRPQGRQLVKYSTDEELTALIDGLVDHLLASCLARQGYEELSGFLIVPPRGEGWTRNVSRQGRSQDVVFAKSATAPGAVHTALALAGAVDAELPSTDRETVVRQLTAGLRREWEAPRFSLAELDISEAAWLGADCVRYRVAARDQGVPGFEGEAFALGARGVRCVHPHLLGVPPARVIDVGYSQRFLGGAWQSAIDSEVEPFLTSLIFVARDPTAHVVAALQRYAALLRELGRKAGAAEVLDLVEKFPRSGGAVRFDPAQRLGSYAAVLRTRGRQAEARDAETLAAAYLRASFRQYLKQYNRAR